MARYQVYPTLLDSFSYFLQSESMTEQEMVDRINRKQQATPAMLQGTAFNNLIDSLCEGRGGLLVDDGKGRMMYKVEESGFEYLFPVDITQYFARLYEPALRQIMLKGNISTRFGDVMLYGFADGVFHDGVRDIKTTNRYSMQKYMHHWQGYAYIHCLRSMGCDPKYFRFDATDLNDVYSEYYPADFYDMRNLVDTLERFIVFAEKHNGEIEGRGRKLFGESV